MNSNHESPSRLRNCLDRRFQFDGDRYVWRSTVGKFAVSVNLWRTKTDTNCVRVAVYDCLSDLEVEEWTHSVRCIDNWRERLQELVGKSMIRAQHRPICPNCSQREKQIVPLLVRTALRTNCQFFGCSNYRSADCRYTLSIKGAFDGGTEYLMKHSEAVLAHSANL